MGDVNESEEIEVDVVNGVDMVDEEVLLVEPVVENEESLVGVEVLVVLGEVEMKRKPATRTMAINAIAISNLNLVELSDIEPLDFGEIRF